MFGRWSGSVTAKVAIVAACAALLSGCAGGGGTADGAAEAAASGPPVAGGSATILLVTEGRRMDPAFGNNNVNGNAPVMNGIFGTLLTTDPETNEIVPSLASSFRTPDGGKTFELSLRDGLTFSDGSPFEAAAVKAHWDRVRDPATGTNYQSDAALVESIEVISSTTLRATMRAPMPNFGHAIVISVLNWVPKPEAIAAGDQAFDARPIGAGPYVLQEWRRQDAIVLRRNPAYWDAPRPYLDEITFRQATDADQRLNNIVSGGADLTLEPNWGSLERARQSGLVTTTQAQSGGIFLAMNSRRPPFDDVRARKAVAVALDPQTINDSVFDGAAELVSQILSPESPLHTDVPVPRPDRAEAQRLFDQLAAEGRRVAFTVTTSGTTENRKTVEALQTMLSTFRNVEVRVTTVEFAEIAGLVVSKNFDATLWASAFRDPEPAFYTNFAGGSLGNMSGIDDPELNSALLAGRTATAQAERKAAYEIAQKRINELYPAFWTTRNNSSVVSNPNVGGVSMYGFGSLQPEQLWIDE